MWRVGIVTQQLVLESNHPELSTSTFSLSTNTSLKDGDDVAPVLHSGALEHSFRWWLRAGGCMHVVACVWLCAGGCVRVVACGWQPRNRNSGLVFHYKTGGQISIFHQKSPNMPSSTTTTGSDLTPYSGDPRMVVPLLRGWDGAASDHFYTTNFGEMKAATNYVPERTPGYIFSNQQPSTIPLYRLWNGSSMDHLYTTDAGEKDNAASRLGYTYEGIPGYVYPDSSCGGLPLYRSYNGSAVDHFYTLSLTEKDNAVKGGWNFEGVACYILPF